MGADRFVLDVIFRLEALKLRQEARVARPEQPASAPRDRRRFLTALASKITLRAYF